MDTSVRMNLVEIMEKENQLLRIKDKAWSKEVNKLKETLKQVKAAAHEKEKKLLQALKESNLYSKENKEAETHHHKTRSI